MTPSCTLGPWTWPGATVVKRTHDDIDDNNDDNEYDDNNDNNGNNMPFSYTEYNLHLSDP